MCYPRRLIFMPSPTPFSVTGEVSSFPHRQLISSFGSRWLGVSDHSRSHWDFESTFQNWFRLSVPRSSKKYLYFFILNHWCYLYINGFVLVSSTNQWKKRYSNFKFVFELKTENRKMFKRIARSKYWSKCNVFYINGFVSTSCTN